MLFPEPKVVELIGKIVLQLVCPAIKKRKTIIKSQLESHLSQTIGI
jgi:hypothetical protein